MRMWRVSDRSTPKRITWRRSGAALSFAGHLVAAMFAFGTAGCIRHEEEVANANGQAEEKIADQTTPQTPRLTRAEIWNKGQPLDVYATWYEVPETSLAKRRAAENEMTAAHNRLPIGTLVRVSNLKNGKSVNVRITDRGIRMRRVKLDLCKEAAEELGMVRKGLARVRMQVLAEGGSAPEAHTAAPQP